MGSQKGDRTHNHGNKDRRRDSRSSAWGDGGNWKKPKAPRRPRRSEEEVAIEASLLEEQEALESSDEPTEDWGW